MPVLITTIHTHLTLDEVRSRVASLIQEPPSGWQAWLSHASVGANGRPFLGRLNGVSFKMTRIIVYRNSFLPVIRGRISQGDIGADVRLVMTLHPLVALFMLGWFTGLGAGAFSAETAGWWLAVVPMGLCVFGAALTLGGFMPEAFKAKRLLCEKLGAA